MNKFITRTLFCLSLTPFAAQSMGINSMVEVAKNGVGNFTVTNTEDYRQFIHVALAAMEVKDGELKANPYTRENINDWTLMVRPARTIIDSKLKKDFKVSFEPKPHTDTSKDHIYQLTFVPTPYFADGAPKQSTMQIAIGFAPIFIVPAKKDKPLHFNMSRDKETITLKNLGGTYIRTFLDACPEGTKGKARDACIMSAYSVSGRNLKLRLSPQMAKAKSIKVELSTHNVDYKKDFSIKSGQTVKL